MTRELEDVLEWVYDGCPPSFIPDRQALEQAIEDGLIVPGRSQPWDLTQDGELHTAVLT